MKSLSSSPCCFFFTALLAVNKSVYSTVESKLISCFGTPVNRLAPQHFEHTRYYQSEMGSELLKGFLGFKPPFNVSDLARSKLITRSIEWATGSYDNQSFQRRVNIDPGYVSLYHTALATSKNFSHRFYLEQGVYGEVTLLYHKNGWEELPWTYPDYKIASVQKFLTKCRELLTQIQPD